MKTNQHLIRIMKEIGYQPDPAGEMKLFYINNVDGSWRWAWPVTQTDPMFLEFYNNGNLKGRVFSLLIEFIFALGLQRFVFKSFEQTFSKIKYEHPASETFEEFAIFSGTEGPDRKAVCCFRNQKAEVIYLKIALAGAATINIEKERRFLQKLSHSKFHTFCYPELLKESYLPFQKSVKIFDAIRISSLEQIHFNYFDELLVDTGTTIAIKETEFWTETCRNIAFLKGLKTTKIPAGIRNKLFTLLQATDPDIRCVFAMAHGDFTPWNCWYASNNRLNLYDFEFAIEKAPALFDLFHFVIQQGVLVEKISAKKILSRLSEAYHEAFRNRFYEEEFNFFFQLYLLYQVSKFLTIYHEQEHWHKQINWLIDIWNNLISVQLKGIESDRTLLNHDILDKLTQLDHVILKSKTSNPYEAEAYSDLDVLVSEKHRSVLHNFLKHNPLIKKLTVRNKHFMTSYDCFLRDGSFLSVDLLTELVRKQYKLIDEKEVLRNRIKTSNGLAFAHITHDFDYTFLFYHLNFAEIPEEHLTRFKIATADQNTILMKHLNQKYNLDLYSSQELSDRFSLSEREQLHQKIARMPFNTFLKRSARSFLYLMDTVRRFFQVKGLIITFSGVDGAGKSTVIETLKYTLEKSTRRPVVVLRHRPSVLPILSAWKYGKAEAEVRSASTLPRQGNNTSLISSLFRFSYYYADYFIGRWKIWFKYILRGYIVLYDRYYFDFINDSRRSNIQLSEAFIKKLYYFIQKPHLNFYLYAPATEIIKRKQELSLDTIEELDLRYKNLFENLGQTYKDDIYLPIENLCVNDTINEISFYIRRELA